MPETPQQFYDRIAEVAAAQPDGRLPVSAEVGDSEIFPFELDGLRVRQLEPPVVPEPPRAGEPGGEACRRCARGEEGAIWADDRWMLTPAGVASLPFAAMLQPREHLDFGELTPALAGELGPLLIAIEHVVKALGDIGRVHVYVVGDGGQHLHVWILARPLGVLQLRGSSLVDWSDLLPPIPPDQLEADQRAVIEGLVASYGGRALLT